MTRDQFEGVNVGDTVRVSYEFEVTRRTWEKVWPHGDD